MIAAFLRGTSRILATNRLKDVAEWMRYALLIGKSFPFTYVKAKRPALGGALDFVTGWPNGQATSLQGGPSRFDSDAGLFN